MNETIAGTLAGQQSAALLGRVLIAAMFMVSGATKLLAPKETIAQIRTAGLPFAPAGLVIAVLIEVALNIPFLLGYQLRPVTMVMVAYCVTAAVVFHHDWRDVNQRIGFWADVAIIGGLLLVFASAPS